LLDTALEAHGRVDVVLNNAGILEIGPVEKIDLERVCRMVRVNVEAAFRTAYTTLRHFREQGHGHLVNISSVLGTKVRPTAGAYAGTKYAIEALSEALRMELAGTDIQVSCIEPGLVRTELHDHWPVHPTKSLNCPHPLTPGDIARCVRFVLEQPPHVRIPRMMVLPGEHQI
jgi:NADP-dependent 3-hydroxy acid dehydrogenase YdfG